MILAAGCGQVFRHDVPGSVQILQEPDSNSDFLLYAPSNYDRNHTWPLVVVCHSGFPDSPRMQINDWSRLAEIQGFIVAAPKLRSGSASRFSKVEAQLGTQSADERQILGLVRHIQGSHNISEDRIFIFGWKGGAVPALHTGLHNPRIFRAVAVTQPKFDEQYFAKLYGKLDPNQPVFVNYGMDDYVTGKHSRGCVEWLQRAGADVRVDTVRSADRTDAERPVGFFRNVISKEQWLQISATTTGDKPLEVGFRLQSMTKPASYHWQFGDGDESNLAEPIHIYKRDGEFTVVVTIEDRKGGRFSRASEITLPGGRLRGVPLPSGR